MEKKPSKGETRPKPVVEEVNEPEETKPVELEVSSPAATSEPEIESEPKLESDSEKSKEKKSYSAKTVIFVALITAVLVGALAGGIYVYLNGISQLETPQEESLPTPSVTATPSATPTSSPAGEVDLSEFKVSVLNGSGKIGEATKVKNLLVKAGFTVSSTANAASFDFTNTVIQTKADVSDTVVEMVKEALKGNYTVEVGDPLAASSTYDIVVTVGSK
jgi:hypothetical protein